MLEYAIKYYGLKEIDGKKSNEDLLKLIQTELQWVDDDSVIAWCAIYGTIIFRQMGLGYLIPDKPYAARSWIDLKYSDEVEVIWERGDDLSEISKKAKAGDIVIFWRGSINGWKGHFAWYVNEYHFDRSKIRVLGGNQDNAVNIRAYSKNRVLIILRIKNANNI